MNVWLGNSEPLAGFRRLPVLKAMTMVEHINILSIEYDIGDQQLTGMDVLQVMRNTPVWPDDGILIHEFDPVLRSQMVKKAIELFDDCSVNIYESPDGGVSVSAVQKVLRNPFA